MEEIINKLDAMVRDMDYHGWELSSEVYGGLTYRDIVKIEKALMHLADLNIENYSVMYIDDEN